MPRAVHLVPPSMSRYRAYLDCIADFDGTAVDGSGITDPQHPPLSEADVRAFITARLAEEDPATELPEGWGHCTSRWIIDAGTEEMLGFVATRHPLTPYPRAQARPIGYAARPRARRR